MSKIERFLDQHYEVKHCDITDLPLNIMIGDSIYSLMDAYGRHYCESSIQKHLMNEFTFPEEDANVVAKRYVQSKYDKIKELL
jgi:hypothetical protein